MLFGRWREQRQFNMKMEQQLSSMDSSIDKSFVKVKDDVAHVQKWIAYLHTQQDRIIKKAEEMDTKIAGLLSKQEVQYLVDQYYDSLDRMNNGMVAYQEQANSHFKNLFGYQQEVFERLESLSNRDFSPIIQAKIQEAKKEITSQIDEEVRSLRDSVFDRLERLNNRIDSLPAQIRPIAAPQLVVPTPAPQPMTVSPEPEKAVRQYLREKIFRKVTRNSKDYVKAMLLSLIKKYGKISGLNLREIVVEEQGIVSKSSLYRLLNEIETDESINVVQEGKEKHYYWVVQNTH